MFLKRSLVKWTLLSLTCVLASAGCYLWAATCTASPTCCNVSCSATGPTVSCTAGRTSATCTSYYANGSVMSSTTVYCPNPVPCAVVEPFHQ